MLPKRGERKEIQIPQGTVVFTYQTDPVPCWVAGKVQIVPATSGDWLLVVKGDAESLPAKYGMDQAIIFEIGAAYYLLLEQLS